MRLIHVLDKNKFSNISDTGKVIKAFIEDLMSECSDEIDWNPYTIKALNKRIAVLYKNYLKQSLSLK